MALAVRGAFDLSMASPRFMEWVRFGVVAERLGTWLESATQASAGGIQKGATTAELQAHVAALKARDELRAALGLDVSRG